MSEPVRLQRSRAKGSRLTSPNGLPVVCVTRPGIFGNPFSAQAAKDLGYVGSDVELKRMAVSEFRAWVTRSDGDWRGHTAQLRLLLARLPDLRGKNLACWCGPDDPCHADVLLELANP